MRIKFSHILTSPQHRFQWLASNCVRPTVVLRELLSSLWMIISREYVARWSASLTSSGSCRRIFPGWEFLSPWRTTGSAPNPRPVSLSPLALCEYPLCTRMHTTCPAQREEELPNVTAGQHQWLNFFLIFYGFLGLSKNLETIVGNFGKLQTT